MTARWQALVAAARRAGWRQLVPMAAALFLFAATIWFAWIAVPAQQRLLQSLAADTTKARSAALRATSTQRTASVSDDAAFIAAFPGAQSRPTRLSQLFSLAEKHGLAWKRGEFSHAPVDALALSRYQVSLPVSGSYDAIRAFVADALSQDGMLSLDEWRMRRPDAASTQLQAELRFTLYARTDDQPPAKEARR
jgi:Tfp pilus assembly protein PilO